MRSISHSVQAALLAGLALVALAAPGSAQVRHDGTPKGSPRTQDVPTFVVPAPDVNALQQEDADNKAQGVVGPLRYGTMIELPITFEDVAEWGVSDDGEHLVGRVRLVAPDAFSLGVQFAEYDLPPGGRLFLYDDGQEQVFGAYTQKNRIHNGEFVVEPFPGDSVILEYNQPLDHDGGARSVHLQLYGLIYDYADIFAIEAGLPAIGSQFGDGCNFVEANCPDGDPYDDEKRAAVRTLYFGGLCSGVIINNTENDETPYLYTANHCGTGSSVVVRFNYQFSGCGTGSLPSNQNMSGAVLLASDVDTDGRFLRLNGSIPDSFNPYYAGWTRSSSNPTFGMSLHHPSGSPKKISIDVNGGFATTSNFIGLGPIKVWDLQFQNGGTAGGSSGSPMWDQNRRLRGVLTGGSSCLDGKYGRFHTFWNESNIATWLDPNSTGVTSIDAFDPFADENPADISIITPTSGPEGGLTVVTIIGTGMDGVNEVTFGGVPGTNLVEVSDTAVRATSPAGTSGTTVAVAVTDGFGTDTLPNAFTYTTNPTPALTMIEPDEGLIGGGEVVTITGTTVVGVTDVQFGGVSGTNLFVLDAQTIQVTTPQVGGAGAVDVTAIGNGSDTLVNGYTYVNPGQFIEIEPGHPGQLGIPVLYGTGEIIPGGPNFQIQTAAVFPNSIGSMFISLDEGAVPFKGGTLYTIPLVIQVPIQASILGTIVLPASLDITVPPGLQIVLQQGFVDAGASNGVSLTNGLKIIVGEN